MIGFRTTASFPEIDKDPDDVLDYTLDFSAWLAGDTIVAVNSAIEEGGDVTIDSASYNAEPIEVAERYGLRTIPAASAAVLWLSGGAVNSRVRTRITTAGNRTRDVTFSVRIVER